MKTGSNEGFRHASLLAAFSRGPLTAGELHSFSIYLDLLLRWNQRINLTAVREPEQVVTRHFGESIFAAEQLLAREDRREVCDVGSGAGFPGLPLKIVRPNARVTLLEAHGKKATFLKEVIRALKLNDIEVLAARAENVERSFDLVTLRAVEHFAEVLPVAAKLVRPGGRLGLLIGAAQITQATEALPQLAWRPADLLPGSSTRVVLEGTKLD